MLDHDCNTLLTAPYFSYVAGVVPKNTFASDFVNSDVLPVPWKDVPACIEQAQDFMQHLGKTYGEQPSPINQLVVLGWTVTGKKKVSSLHFVCRDDS